MRKTAGIFSAIALVTAVLGIWSNATFLTRAAGLVTAYDIDGLGVGEKSAAAAVQDRFPLSMEMFQPVEFIRQPANANRHLAEAALVKADKQKLNLADCDGRGWPYFVTECVVSANGKPVRKADRVVTVERRIGLDTSELVRAPIVNATVTGACRHNLAAAAAGMERALAHVNALRTSSGGDKCATYRSDFFEMVKARAVTASCKTGSQRDQDLGRIDVAVENINGAIALSCGT